MGKVCLVVIGLAVVLTVCCEKVNVFESPTADGISVVSAVGQTNTISEDSDIIEFKDHSIKMMAEAMLQYNDSEYRGPITKNDALTVTMLGAIPKESGGLMYLKGDIKTLEDLQWFPNVTKIHLQNCNVSDLTGIESLDKLEILDLRKNNITDLSPIKSCFMLKEFNVSENKIADLSPLEKLSNLTDLSASYNQIRNTSVFSKLVALTSINLDENPVDNQEITNFFANNDNKYIVYKKTEKINENMLEFRFEVLGYGNGIYYGAERLKVYNMGSNEKLCDIYLPDYSFWGGRTHGNSEDFGFKLIDVNFDGYKDIELYDTQNGRFIERLFVTWNQQRQRFEMDKELSSLSNLHIDEARHELSTSNGGRFDDYSCTFYKYINSALVKVRVESLKRINVNYETLCNMTAIAKEFQEDELYLEHHITVDSITDIVVENNYVLYKLVENGIWDKLYQVDFSSEEGQRLGRFEKKQ